MGCHHHKLIDIRVSHSNDVGNTILFIEPICHCSVAEERRGVGKVVGVLRFCELSLQIGIYITYLLMVKDAVMCAQYGSIYKLGSLCLEPILSFKRRISIVSIYHLLHALLVKLCVQIRMHLAAAKVITNM